MRNAAFALFLVFATGLALGLPQAAWADGGGGDSSFRARVEDPDLADANKAIQGKDWSRAIEHLNRALERDSGNAEAYNLRGYSERMRGDLDSAFKDYDRALTLDPKHRGAHEYLGEAYLMVGNLAKAEEHLARLDKLCFFSCSEYRDLKRAIAAYREKHPQ